MNKEVKEKMYKITDCFEFYDFLDEYFPQYQTSGFAALDKEVRDYYITVILGTTEEKLKEMEDTIVEYRDMEED